MRHSRKNISLVVTVLVLLFAASGCRVWVPLPPHPHVRAPRVTHYAPPRAARHHYRYFPGTEVYFDTTSNIYFYLSDNIWLSAPLLPSHIRIDLNNFVTMELGGPKPYIYHKETIKRYPPGLRKEKHRKQREKLRDKRENQRERLDKKKARQKEQLQRQKDQLDRREDKLDRRENKLERRETRQDNKKKSRKKPKGKQNNNRTKVKKKRQETKQEAREYRKTKKNKKDEEEYEQEEYEKEEKRGRRKAIWK